MLLAFGEIMMRVCPPGMLRFRQALPGSLDCTFGGGEANVCGSLALLGRPVRYMTALPTHAIADAVVERLRGLGVDTRCILRRDEGRLGIYFLEAGANQRASQVIYDRDHSAVMLAAPDEYDFEAALRRRRPPARDRHHAVAFGERLPSRRWILPGGRSRPAPSSPAT